MEGSSSSSAPPPPHSNQVSAAGASKYLSDLPSAGLFSSFVPSSIPGGMRVYTCDHDTAPPEGQLIKTSSTNILIRALTLKKSKGDSSSKDAKALAAADGAKKRAADKVLDGRAAAKRPMSNAQNGARQEAVNVRVPNKDYRGLTVERLRALLKERGLSLRGRKDELIARLNGTSG